MAAAARSAFSSRPSAKRARPTPSPPSPAAPQASAELAGTGLLEQVVFPALYPSERGVYAVHADETIALWKSLSGGNKKLESVVRTNGSNRHNLTYGEILPSSFAADVIPLLGPMTRDDVVIDLGSGTGKLCVQLALETGAGRVRGIEFASRRCDVADEALRRMSGVGSEDLGSAMAKGPVAASLFGSDWEDADTGAVPEEEEEEAEAQSTAAAITNAAAAGPESARVPAHLEPVIREAATRLSLERGCFIAADLSDVTVAFVNNTVFEPDLMNALLRKLATGCPKLRRLVCLRKLCCRHGRRCTMTGAPCTAFVHPPTAGTLNPTWCEKTTVFAYDIDQDGRGLVHAPPSPTTASSAPSAAAAANVASPARAPRQVAPSTPRKRPRDEDAADAGGAPTTPPTVQR
ncbi:hypothetical protein FNF31_02687 [Cafeteria roenbergensis]|uniref:Histone-lysine N-methyltransferase, H3 lysine-79 specific n=1 Tax=Cafeteria roenbergensis TaxID=33653 RepID=A0A5A8DEN5_CAFRO|nr:hypothetical protein FNF31_02687 [Cafeteria roenbergensis]